MTLSLEISVLVGDTVFDAIVYGLVLLYSRLLIVMVGVLIGEIKA